MQYGEEAFCKIENHLSPVNFNTHFLCQQRLPNRVSKKNKAQRCHRKQKREAAEIRNSSDNYYLRSTKTLQTQRERERERATEGDTKKEEERSTESKKI